MAYLQKSFSLLLVVLLVLTGLPGSGNPVALTAPSQAQTGQESMSDGLMNAFLAASSQPVRSTTVKLPAYLGGLDFSLSPSGVQAGSRDFSWGLGLSGVGRGEQMTPVPQAMGVQSRNRLEYRRGAVTEWYRHTPMGLEQGFTIYQAPQGEGLFVLQLCLSTGLSTHTDVDMRGLSFSTPGGQTLRYDHLLAWDANGVQLDAKLAGGAGQVKLLVNDREATYPITIDPLIYYEQKVLASGAANDNFGVAVALSEDTALVGAFQVDIGANNAQGAAYVFTRIGTQWMEQAKLVALDGAMGDWFGRALAISGDTALVGVSNATIGSNLHQGAVYIFTRSGSTWTQQTKLTAPDGVAGDMFGYSVAVSGDTALAGGIFAKVGSNLKQGAAYVFTRSGTIWSLQQKLTSSNGLANDHFGSSLALSGDTAVVGASNAAIGPNLAQGAVYIFTRNGITWSQQPKLVASDGHASDLFGASLALSQDTLLVGAAYADIAGKNDQGAAYVFTRNGLTWAQQAKLIAPDGEAGDYFGQSVALSGDTALVGAPAAFIGINSDQGAAYVFTPGATSWNLQQKLTAPDGAAGDIFGVSVALSGNTAFVGALNDAIGPNSSQGSVSVFTRNLATWSRQQILTGSDGAFNDTFGFAVAISGNTALVGVPGSDIGPEVNQGSAYVFTRSGTDWSLQQKLTSNDGSMGDTFGRSVALSGDTALVGAYGDDIGSHTAQGSAYVFTRSGATWTQQGKLTAPDGATNNYFGVAVALSGNTALVGAFNAAINIKPAQGAAYLFTRFGTTWTFQNKLMASDGAANDHFGLSVALSGDSALIGAPLDDNGSITDQGSVYVFNRVQGAWTQQAKLTANDGAASDYFGVSVAISGDTALVGAYGDDIDGYIDQGSAYVFTGSGTTWSQQAKLTASDGTGQDKFGLSVALSYDTALVGSFQDDVAPNADQGSVFLFTRSGTIWKQQAKLNAPDGAAGDAFGFSVALSGVTALIGAPSDDISPTIDQGSAYFFNISTTCYLPAILKGAP